MLLLLLYASDAEQVAAPIPGRTRLMKAAFLFQEEIHRRFRFDQLIDDANMPEFFAWKYGPFSADVLNDVEFFRILGFVSADPSANEPAVEEQEEYQRWVEDSSPELPADDEYAQEVFRLTAVGQQFVEERLWPEVSENQRETLGQFKRRINGMSLYRLLQYVYSHYPSYTDKSEIAHKF